MAQPVRTLAEVAARFGCTVEQVRAQYQRNIAQLAGMLEKAKASKTGKHRGFTAEELADRIATFQAIANG